MVQVTVHDVVDVFAVRDGRMAAARAVTMRGGVCSAVMPLRARVGVLLADGDGVLLEVITLTVMKVAVVQVVPMAFVLDDRVAAAFLVLVLVLLVNAMGVHASPSCGPGGIVTSHPRRASELALGIVLDADGPFPSRQSRGHCHAGACRPADFRP